MSGGGSLCNKSVLWRPRYTHTYIYVYIYISTKIEGQLEKYTGFDRRASFGLKCRVPLIRGPEYRPQHTTALMRRASKKVPLRLGNQSYRETAQISVALNLLTETDLGLVIPPLYSNSYHKT